MEGRHLLESLRRPWQHKETMRHIYLQSKEGRVGLCSPFGVLYASVGMADACWA
jgi:hypothetical protein